MPIPKPNANESQDQFIGRCISTLSKADPDRDPKQVQAICYSTWRKSKGMSEEAEIISFKLTPKSWKDIETEELDGGLLVKDVPVFRTGTHKGNKYDEKYIDEKILANFKPENNVPVQADHSDSYRDTLGTGNYMIVGHDVTIFVYNPP